MINENSTNADATLTGSVQYVNATPGTIYPNGITISTGYPTPVAVYKDLSEYKEVSDCKKCGLEGISKVVYGKNELQEWLHKYCSNCGYGWDIHTRDYEIAKPACGCEGCKC